MKEVLLETEGKVVMCNEMLNVVYCGLNHTRDELISVCKSSDGESVHYVDGLLAVVSVVQKQLAEAEESMARLRSM